MLGPLALAGGFAALAAWSWGRWTDVHVDFGNELYLAWRLAEGDVLYRDLAYRHGPLSPYWNAAAFALGGVSLRTLVWLNLAILAAIVTMTFALFARAASRLAAGTACAVLLGVFAFSQYTAIANYNYVTPYHHQQTHGIALSIAMILGLARATRAGGRPTWLAAGLCLGGVFLTKAELALPALLAAAVGLAAARPRRDAVVLFAAAALAPAAGFALFLAAQMPPGQALAGLLGNFRYLGAGLLGDPFYTAVSGLDDVPGNALRALQAGALLGGFAVLAAALDRLAPAALRSPPAAPAAGLALALIAIAAIRPGAWLGLARGLPLVAALGVAVLGRAWLRADATERARRAPLLVWAVWSLSLLGKVLLHARFEHYGFALAMPATLLAVVLLVETLPAGLRLRYGGGGLARALAVGVVAAGAVACLRVADAVYARKTFRVGFGSDAVLAEAPRVSARPARVQHALERLAALAGPDASLLVLPEGVGFNYWLRLENPIPFSLFLPTEIGAFGEARMLAALRASPPDWVALVHRGHREFGVGPFGSDARYGRGLLEWVRAGYEPVERIGPEPFGAEGFGIALLRRRGTGEAAVSGSPRR